MPSATDTRASWLRLVLSLAAATIANVGMWSIVVIMPAVQSEFGVSRAGTAFPYTATMFGFALGNFLLGRAVDRFGIAATLAVASAVLSAGFLVASQSPSVAALAAAQFFIGAAAAVGFGPLLADISHWFLRRRGIAVALVASGNYLAGAIWPMVLARELAEDGWRSVYMIVAVAVSCGLLPLAWALRGTAGGRPSLSPAPGAAVILSRTVGLSPRRLQYILGLAGIGCCVAMSMPQVHIVALCVDLGFGPAVGAEMLALMLAGGVASRLVSGLLADRFGGVRTLLIGSALQCAALFLYLPAGGIVSLYAVSLVFGLSQGGIVPSYAIIVREYMPASEAGARVGFVMMATIFGMALGGWLSGLIYDLSGSYALAFVNGILWNGLNIGIMLWLLWRGRPRAMVPAV